MKVFSDFGLEKEFIPAIEWKRNYLEDIVDRKDCEPVAITLKRDEESISRWDEIISPSHPQTIRYIERIFKQLLWIKGGYEITVSNKACADYLAKAYAVGGEREFDFYSKSKTAGAPLRFIYKAIEDMDSAQENYLSIGGHLDGCRIGFDLGGSDRKCAAVIDGEVIFTEEVPWNPYFQTDPQYHIDGIRDSLKRAAAHLPHVDAIGGSAAGVYNNNRVMAASLFRGISQSDFDEKIKNLFIDIQKEWGVPLVVINDGEVTALAGSMSLKSNGVLGVSMGTSMAVGYITQDGRITPWLNELAFIPVDLRENAPVDEWSGDMGCAVQYFSQQGVARLAKAAGLDYGDMPFPEQLVEVQKLMSRGDNIARSIYETIGICFGYAIDDWSSFYDISKLLVLGRVTSGKGGEIIIEQASSVLKEKFPELYDKIDICTPDEKFKRHGQAIAAASLPAIDKKK